ncbi:ABC transporter permease [Candidatus Latescibacterota bacterium]
MNYQESFFVGLEGLRSHLLRSLLSMLGIIFGVGAVIAMLSIGEGAKQEALEQIQLMGMNNIIVQDIPITDEADIQQRTSKSVGLTWADARAVRELNPLVETTVPMREISKNILYENVRNKTSIVGTTPEYMPVMNYFPLEGSFFTYRDVEEERRVCILGYGIKRDLFYFRDALGKNVKIGDQWYTVIGVMEEKAVSSSRESNIPASDMNQNVYIPITTMLKRYSRDVNESEINRIIARSPDVSRIQEAANILKNTLERRHNRVPDFRITVPEALLRQSQQTQRIFNIVMGAIAGISLLVGGIGIMNIMLASILERTREIGVRRAIGATQKDILGQFMMEAVMLSFVGGMIGILLGFTMTKIIAAFADWRTIVSMEAIFLAFGVSVGIGVIFGVYPARRAALKDPIESLRYE